MASAPAASPRVLVLTLSFGAGHLRAGAAIAEAVRLQAPDVSIEIVDALESASPLFRAVYVWPYWAMIRFAPSLWRRLFTSRLRHERRHTAPVAWFRAGCRRTFARIRGFRPDVIVAAEVGACEIAVAARRAGLTAAAIVAVITDAQAEPAWVAPEVVRYAVPSAAVAEQLARWRARATTMTACGIPVAAAFSSSADKPDVVHEPRPPRVLLMGGGSGPTRMDEVAAALRRSGLSMEIVAVTGRDAAARRRLERLDPEGACTLRVLGWTDDVASLMRSATVLVTKPGGLTIAEAASCGVPLVLFDPIPGPEEANAAAAVAAGAAVLTRNSAETARETLRLFEESARRQSMADAARAMARPAAADDIARAVLEMARAGRPSVFLTIGNGAGHTRTAEAIADALTPARAEVLDVADYLTPAARFTHVTAYLWIVRRLPRVWDAIDRAQKRRPSTSPAWYYRRGARRLFTALASLQPAAMAATEVGCCEIAALVKRDQRFDCPLVAVNAEYDADRAWVQPEVTRYAVAAEQVASAFVEYGVDRARIDVTGVPLHADFTSEAGDARQRICSALRFEPASPLILVAGGSEGLGSPDRMAEALLSRIADVQIVLLAGRSRTYRRRAEARLDRYRERVRVLGWTPRVAELMAAADVLVSKLGHTFDEAIALRLPIVALPPPPGAERIQYRLLAEWGVGCPVEDVDEAVEAVERLVRDDRARAAMRHAAASRGTRDAAASIARSLRMLASTSPPATAAARGVPVRAAARSEVRA